ncbi:MAG TPA: DoxX family protein [Vicinamibacterales bacterium]|nr:DoxX family protein [Vicinamibacterales bacterium]
MPENRSSQVEDVSGSGIYPASGPLPPGAAPLRTPAGLAHPEERHVGGDWWPTAETAAQLVGRALFGGYFVYNGVNHFLNRSMLVEYARSKGVPAPEVSVVGSGLLILAGGLSLLTGARPKIGAGLITTFLLGVSPQMHAFWKEQDAQQRMNDMINFTKNMALLGGALLAAAQREPWPLQAAARGGPLVRSGH